MARTTRRDKINEYIDGWHSGYWNLNVYSLDGQDVRLAENVLSWNEIAETRTNINAYVSTIRDMIADGSLKVHKGMFSGTYAFETTTPND
jgi:hypothetical protein